MVQLHREEEEDVPCDPVSLICDDSPSNDCVSSLETQQRMREHGADDINKTHSAPQAYMAKSREKWITSKTLALHPNSSIKHGCAIQFDSQVLDAAQYRPRLTPNLRGNNTIKSEAIVLC